MCCTNLLKVLLLLFSLVAVSAYLCSLCAKNPLSLSVIVRSVSDVYSRGVVLYLFSLRCFFSCHF